MSSKIAAADANVQYAELLGVVTVGEESAKRLTKLLGRKVEIGEQFDLGTLAVFYKDEEKNEEAQKRVAKNTPFS